MAIFTEFVGELRKGPNIFIGEVATVVVLSGLFEAAEHSLRKEMAATGDETGQKILNSLFKEVTSLGYIGLFVFLATHSGVADALVDVLGVGGHHGAAHGGEAVVGKEGEAPNVIAETFEVVHIMIFMLVTVLLFQAAAVLSAARQVLLKWDVFERSRAFGTAHDSLETRFIEKGFLERREDHTQPRGVELRYIKPFTFGSDFAERVTKRQDSLVKLVMWRVIRHEFLFPSGAGKTSRESSPTSMPKPRFFSFQEYLGGKLGDTVLSLVEVDQRSWLLTLIVLIPLVYYCITLDFVSVEVVQCASAWLLLAAAYVLVNFLEEETFQLTPVIPNDARQILRLLEGTNAAFSPDEVVQAVESPVPGLGDASKLPAPKLSRPVAFGGSREDHASAPDAAETQNLKGLSTKFYKRAFQIIAFWQACIATSLIFTILSEPLETPSEIALYAFTWVEWPIMLFWVVPIFLRRFTIRNSIERKKDMKTIRKVSLNTKEGLLKDYVRLFQIFNMERRAKGKGEPWTVKGHKDWSPQHASEKFEQGLSMFRGLPQADKLDIWKIYAAWDVNNDEEVCVNEISQTMKLLLKLPEDADNSVEDISANLIRLVDHDNAGTLTWRKFKALVMLATFEKPREELIDDLSAWFSVLDVDGDGEITIFELAEWSKRGPIGMERDEFATLLYRHFDRAKPSVTKEEFVEWIEAF